jgi:hypothetical protein
MHHHLHSLHLWLYQWEPLPSYTTHDKRLLPFATSSSSSSFAIPSSTAIPATSPPTTLPLTTLTLTIPLVIAMPSFIRLNAGATTFYPFTNTKVLIY